MNFPVDVQLAQMMEDMNIKIQELEHKIDARKDEVSTLNEKLKYFWFYVKNAACGQLVQFRALMQVMSLSDIQEMAAYVNGSDYTECPQAYSIVLSEINDMAINKGDESFLGVEESRTYASVVSTTARNTPDLAGNELVLAENQTDLTNSGRGGEDTAAQDGANENTNTGLTTSTPVHRTREERDNNFRETRNFSEATNRHPADINRRRNVVISNIPENLSGGDKGGVIKVLEAIECEELLQKVEAFTRLGAPKDSGDRLLKLIMKNECDAEKILLNKDKLKNSNIPEVYINRDLCKSDRIKEYQARRNRRSTAAESARTYEGRWGARQATLVDYMGDFVHEGRQREDAARGMGGRGGINGRTRNQGRQPREDRGLPNGWEVRYGTYNGRCYYKNTFTGENQYEFPTEPARGRRSQEQNGWANRDSRRSGSRNNRSINRREETFSGNEEEWGDQPGMW